MITVSRHKVGASLLCLTLFGADSTHAQLRSLAAIKHLALESSPGAERQTKALQTHDSLKMHKGLLVPTLESVPAEDHPYFARCVVRANLPKPLNVGLECYDAAGAYVGTKRAANVDRLAFDVWSAITHGGPFSRPLHSYRYIYVEPFVDRYDRYDYLVNLLRQSSVFTVIYQHEALAMPEAERALILGCKLDRVESYSPPWFVGTSVSYLLVFNMDNEKVGGFRGEARWTFVTSEAQIKRKMLESAVQELIRAGQEDEFTYARPEKE